MMAEKKKLKKKKKKNPVKRKRTKKEKEIRKRNYALVRNITGDAKLAERARDWSIKRIKETYVGITEIPTKPPRLIPIKTLKPPKRKISRDLPITDESTTGIVSKKATYDTRKEVWSVWAKGDGKESKFPYRIRRLAKQINQRQYNPKDKKSEQRPFDDYAGYGFAVVWHAYVVAGDISPKTLLFYEQQLTPDLHDGDMYVTPTRRSKR
jgi:hypothetical protein